MEVRKYGDRSFLVFSPGELRLCIGRLGDCRVEPRSRDAALALIAIRDGVIRVPGSHAVELRVSLEDGAAAEFEVRNG